jgi:hypothetical protein
MAAQIRPRLAARPRQPWQMIRVGRPTPWSDTASPSQPGWQTTGAPSRGHCYVGGSDERSRAMAGGVSPPWGLVLRNSGVAAAASDYAVPRWLRRQPWHRLGRNGPRWVWP